MKVVPPVSIGVAGGFTRSTTGTFIGSNGLLQTAAINVPRFSYDVEDLDAAPAFLQESAATNKLLRSRDGTNAAWTKTDTSTAQTQTGIDGSSNAATLYTEGTAGTALVVQAGDTVSAGSTITYSEYLKRGNTDWVRLVVGETTLTDYAACWFNLATGAVGTPTAYGAATLVTARISAGPGGYYRCEVTARPNASYTTPKAARSSASANSSTTRVNNATYIADYAQLEVAAVATSAIATTSVVVTRAADVLTGQGLMYSSVAEPDTTVGEEIWVSGTSYVADDEVIVVAQHRKYKRISDGAGTTSPEDDPVNWEDIGPTNRHAMLDLYRNTATEQATTFTVVIKPGTRVDSIGFIDMQASEAVISVDVGSTNYYYESFNTLIRNTTGLYSYFFGAFRYVENLVRFDLPPISGATITITLTGSTVRCSGVVIGMAVYIGEFGDDGNLDDLNFSKFNRDDFANMTLTPRPSIPKIDGKVLFDKELVKLVRQLKKDVDAVPALYVCIEDPDHDWYDPFVLLGVWREFRINTKPINAGIISIQLEGY